MSMFRLFIVEDEEIFRKVLPKIIDWNSIGFDIVGTAENGFEALKLLEHLEVDVILTDIRMPVLNGLELAMEVKSRYPSIKTILLSAFNEFEYAKRGIDCGVYGYLLKSDDEENISSYFMKLAEVLAQEILVDKADDSLWGSRQVYFKNLINPKGFDADAIVEQGKKLSIDIPRQNFILTVIKLDDYNSLVQAYGPGKIISIIKSIRTFLVKNIDAKKLGYVFEVDDILCVIWNQSVEDCIQIMRNLYRDLAVEMSIMEMPDRRELTVTFAYAGPVEGAAGLCKAYSETLSMFMHRTYLGGNKILNITNLNGRGNQIMTFSEEKTVITEILGLMQGGDSNTVIQYIDAYEDNLAKICFMDINQIIMMCIKIILAVSNDVGQMRGNNQEFQTKTSYQIKELCFYETITAVFKQLKLFLVEAIVLLNKENHPANSRIIEEAVKYMQDNYEKAVTLEGVAKHVNVHPVHLSRLFSQDFGKTFKSALTDIRIEVAKKMLLDTNNKVYEVSFAVGYETPRYFSELFRSITGLTPVEYREKYKA